MVKCKYFFFVFVVFAISCSKSDNEMQTIDTNYYPFTENTYQIYRIDSIYHDLIHDTSFYYLKEVVKDTFVDDLGRINSKIFRYKRPDLLSPWVFDEVWYGYKDDIKVERREYNKRTVSIVFPVRNNKSWDLNIYNDLEESTVVFKNTDEPYTLNALDFNKSVLVDGEEVSNLIEFKRVYDVYAYGIGLIEKQRVDLEINNFDRFDIVRGTEYYQTIIEWGEE